MDVVYQWRTYDCGEKPERDKVALTPPVWEVTDEGLWTLTGDQYSILGELIADLIKAMEQMKEVIYFYERCIVTAKALTNE